MPHFSYHNRLKQLLRTEEYIVIKEDGKPFAYRFIFPRIMKTMPIRDYRVEEYREYLKGEQNERSND